MTSQARTIACIGTSYVAKLAAAAVLLFAFGEAVNVVSMWRQARKDGCSN